MDSVIPIYIQRDNVNDETVMILNWHVNDGDAVRAGQLLVDVETSKAAFGIESPGSGIIKRTAPSEGEVAIGEVLCYVGDSLAAIETYLADEAAAEPVTAAPAAASTQATDYSPSAQVVGHTPSSLLPPSGQGRRFSRKAQELIRSRGLLYSDLNCQGLIREHDVLLHLGEAIPQPQLEESVVLEPGTATRGASGVAVHSELLPRAKRLETRLLSWNHRHALRSSVTTAVSTCGLQELKKKDSAVAEQFSATVLYECARLLRKYPHLNAYADNQRLHCYEQINIGYALDAEHGLKVPVVRNADSKSILSIIDERRQFLVDYLNDEMRPEAMAGGTFTVTDLSDQDVFLFDPLIVEGQSAILGIGGHRRKSGVTEGIYNLILAFDHRVAEGRMASRFLSELKERLIAHEEAIVKTVAAPAPHREPYCSRCLATLSDIQRINGHLLQIIDNLEGKTNLVCNVCHANW